MSVQEDKKVEGVNGSSSIIIDIEDDSDDGKGTTAVVQEEEEEVSLGPRLERCKNIISYLVECVIIGSNSM